MKQFIISVLLTILLSASALGHSGGTDSRGGHNDRIHGGYHFHHGLGPHQHPGGVCPYSSESSSLNSSGSSNLKWYIGGALAMGGLFIYVKWKQGKTT